MKLVFQIELPEKDMDYAIEAYGEEMNTVLSVELDNVRKLILEGLRNANTELTMIKTDHLIGGGEN